MSKKQSSMSPAEFVCARELLGLPINWVAEQLGVSKRAVYRWEAGTYQIPERAAERMRAWVAQANQMVGMATLAVNRDTSLCHTTFQDGQEELEMPASWHRMVTARAAERTGREIRWVST